MRTKTWCTFILALLMAVMPSSSTVKAARYITPIQDPLIFSCTLENGMRYAVMPNDGPENTASIRLYINIGSLVERETERGFAHFVEHMAFNGSESVAEGDLVKILQRAGLSFGADVNASTDFEKTLYKLELPNVAPNTIDTALMLLRETASNLSFNQEAVAREKGVLLSEFDLRDTTGLETYRKQLNFWAPNARGNHRFPIGTKASISAATSDALEIFYTDFYRPENALLVFVGDVDVAEVEKRIATHFSDWQNTSPTRDTAYMTSGVKTGNSAPFRTVTAYIKEGARAGLSVSAFKSYIAPEDTWQARAAGYKRALANYIFNQRLAKLARTENTPFVNAQAGYQPLHKEKMQSIIRVSSTDENILAVAPVIEQELRRLLEHGFTEGELTQYTANFMVSFEHAVTAADKRPNDRLADTIIANHHAGLSTLHPDTQLEIFREVADSLSPEGLTDVFREMWATDEYAYFITSTTPLKTIETRFADAIATSKKVAVSAPAATKTSTFAYTNFGKPGSIRSTSDEKKPVFTKVRFNNGVMLNIMRTQWEDNTVRMAVRFGGGILSFPKKLAGLESLASIAFVNGGLEKHSIDEINRLIAGKTISARLAVAHDSFTMNGAVATKDVLAQLQLWAAYITEPAFRPEAYSLYKRAIPAAFQAPRSTPRKALSRIIGKHLYGGDPRFFLPSQEHLAGLTLDDVKHYMAQGLSDGAIEITLVGDLDIEAIKEAAAATFGALPVRADKPATNDALSMVKFHPEADHVVIRHQGKASQAILQMYWPTDGRHDVELSAKLALLARVMNLKLRETVRENAGISYSPSVSSQMSSTFSGYGTFVMSTDLSPDEIEIAETLFLESVTEMQSTPIDDDLLERARKPYIEGIYQYRKNNNFWLNLLTQAQTAPETITFEKDYVAALEGVTAEQLMVVAGTYLQPEKLFKVHVIQGDVAWSSTDSDSAE